MAAHGCAVVLNDLGASVEIIRDVILVLHFVGLAALLGSFLVQAKGRTKKVDATMLHGALTQLVTGLALVGLAEAQGDNSLDMTKVAVKLVVLLVIGALVWRYRSARSISIGVWAAIGGLTLLNVVVAVLW